MSTRPEGVKHLIFGMHDWACKLLEVEDDGREVNGQRVFQHKSKDKHSLHRVPIW